MHRPPIGSGVSSSSFPFYHPFKGRIQEVALYGQALSVGRVSSGFGLFAGPDPASPDVWQIWLGDGTSFLPMKDPARNLTPVDFTKSNYLVVTSDDPTKTLNMFVYVQEIDLVSEVGHPLKNVTVASFSPVADVAGLEI